MRHVTDTIARTHIARVEGVSEQERLAFARRQQPGQHFHGRGLAAAVRADESEDLAPLDGEAHPVDCREIAETTSEAARDDDRLGVDDAVRRYLRVSYTHLRAHETDCY